ncbi:MAG: c-type cytochrome [Granulicella sp.]
MGVREAVGRAKFRAIGLILGMAAGVTLCVGLAGVGAARVAGQERRTAKASPMTRPEVQRGMAEFQQSCSMCHGPEAKGASGPNLIESSLVRHDEKGELIGPLIREGRLSRGMPGFPNTSAAQEDEIVAFLHAMVQVSDNRGSGGTAQGYSLKRMMTGDATQGKAYFNGPGRCSECHSVSGDLKGVAKRYRPQELEARILYPSGGMQRATVTLGAGERVVGQLLHLDGFYVAMVDAQGQYRSWPLRGNVKVHVEDPLRGHRELLEQYKDKDIHDVFAYLETLQ